MRFAVVYSKKDIAGTNIVNELKKFYLPQIQIIELKKDSIHSENIDSEIPELKNIEFIIFASKHASKTQEKTLSVHATGNWRNADYGGKPGKLCKTSSLALKFLINQIQENQLKLNLLDYKVTLESTHHGPLIEKPCIFIEVGATETEWNDKIACQAIAQTIADFQKFQEYKSNNKSIKTAIAIGGPHYCPNFTKIQLSKTSNLSISHILPEYHLPANEGMLKEAINKTLENVESAIIDWKGCGKSEDKLKLIELIKKSGLEVLRTDQINK